MQNGELTGKFYGGIHVSGQTFPAPFFGKIATILWAAMVASCEEWFSLVLHRITQTLNLEELKFCCVHTIKLYILYEKKYEIQDIGRAAMHTAGCIKL